MAELRKNGKGAPVVYGKASEVTPGKRFVFGDKEVVVPSVGKPFKVGGKLYVYGYMTGPGSTRAVGSVLGEMFK